MSHRHGVTDDAAGDPAWAPKGAWRIKHPDLAMVRQPKLGHRADWGTPTLDE